MAPKPIDSAKLGFYARLAKMERRSTKAAEKRLGNLIAEPARPRALRNRYLPFFVVQSDPEERFVKAMPVEPQYQRSLGDIDKSRRRSSNSSRSPFIEKRIAPRKTHSLFSNARREHSKRKVVCPTSFLIFEDR